jgi:hypothetical protein
VKQAIFQLDLAHYDYHLLGRNSRLPLLGYFLRLWFKLTSVISKTEFLADFPPNGAHVYHTSALVAIEKLEDRIRTTEQELADMKFKVPLMNQ